LIPSFHPLLAAFLSLVFTQETAIELEAEAADKGHAARPAWLWLACCTWEIPQCLSLSPSPNPCPPLPQETAIELEAEAADEAAEEMEGEAAPLSTKDILVRAIAKMGAGIALCAVFSDPLVEALTNLSRATGLPPFVVGFVLTPVSNNPPVQLSRHVVA
jgi:Ca2+/Na+ antiporter